VIDQIWKRLQLAFSPGVLTRGGDDRVQARLLSDEVLDNVRHIEPYGLSYRPLPGAQPYVFFPAGDRSAGFAVVTGDRRYQMQIEGGEVAIHDNQGNYVHIKQSGDIEINAAAAVTLKSPVEVVIDAPLLRVTGDILDQSSSAGKTMAAMRQTYNTHTHPENDNGGPTNAPNEKM
jgi:phage gp45-like